MKLARDLIWVAKHCVPEHLRIWNRKVGAKDIFRDGRWLRFKIRAEYKQESKRFVSKLKPWKILPVDTKLREQKIEEMQDRYAFSFESMLVITNPYEETPLCALLVFESEELCRVRVRVKGKEREEDSDFIYETSVFRKRQRVPVLGLYAACANIVIVELINRHGRIQGQKAITIKIGKLPEKFNNMLKTVRRSGDTAMPFTFVTGGISGSTYVFDSYGEIRYFLSRLPRQYGVYGMPDGRFLVPERHINERSYVNPHANIMYDMDLLGRVSKVYNVPGGIHHWCTALPGSNGDIILGAASARDQRVENRIISYDRRTGKIIRKWELGDVFPKKFQKRCDWAHLNCIFCLDSRFILFSLRNRHTVAKFDLESGKLVWILSILELYEGTKLEKKILRPVGEEFHHFYQQHAVMRVDTRRPEERAEEKDAVMEIMLFDNHCMTKTKAPYFDGKEESYVCFYEIDETALTVKTKKVFACEQSPTRCNGWFDPEKRRVFAMSGGAMNTENCDAAQIYEWDYDSMEEISHYEIREYGFFKAYPFQIMDTGLEGKLQVPDDYRRGQLEPPVVMEQNLSLEHAGRNGKMPKEIEISCMDDLLLFYAQDHKVEKVYLQGEDAVWERDFTDTVQKSETFAEKSYWVAVTTQPLSPGRYHIYVRYEGTIYDTGQEIGI